MKDDIQLLADHLSATVALPPAQTRRLVEDVLAYFSETVETYVARRHSEMQERGIRNDTIFNTLAEELTARRFATTPLTTRQIRRLIYG